MAHTTLIPYSITNPSRTPRRRHWRRTTTTIVNSNQKMHITQTVLVHNKPLSPLPDIVNDCQKKSHIDATEIDNHQTNLTCKQIAHSLRIVADQVDQKYCNVSFWSFLSFTIRYLYNYYLGWTFLRWSSLFNGSTCFTHKPIADTSLHTMDTIIITIGITNMQNEMFRLNYSSFGNTNVLTWFLVRSSIDWSMALIESLSKKGVKSDRIIILLSFLCLLVL